MTSQKTSLILLAAIATAAFCGTSYAQTTLIGSPGAGWQAWTTNIDPTDPLKLKLLDLDDDHAPYWDSPWGASGAYGGTNLSEKNAGFCMASLGDCQGIGVTRPRGIAVLGDALQPGIRHRRRTRQ